MSGSSHQPAIFEDVSFLTPPKKTKTPASPGPSESVHGKCQEDQAVPADGVTLPIGEKVLEVSEDEKAVGNPGSGGKAGGGRGKGGKGGKGRGKKSGATPAASKSGEAPAAPKKSGAAPAAPKKSGAAPMKSGAATAAPKKSGAAKAAPKQSGAAPAPEKSIKRKFDGRDLVKGL